MIHVHNYPECDVVATDGTFTLATHWCMSCDEPAAMPRHRRNMAPIRSNGTPVFDVQNNATCTCPVRGWATCPRHNPATYADQQARHATDSIAPILFAGWAR